MSYLSVHGIMKHEKKRAFLAALTEVITRFEHELDKASIAGLLSELAEEFEQGNKGPSVSLEGPARGPLVCRIEYPTGLSLERTLPDWLETGCVFLSVEKPPPVMTELGLELHCAGVDRPVQLSGRVVQQTPTGVAVEVFRPTENQRLQLTRLPEKMRAARQSPRATAIVEAIPQAVAEEARTAAPPPPAPVSPGPVSPSATAATPPVSTVVQMPQSSPPPAETAERSSRPSELLQLTSSPRQSWDVSRGKLSAILCDVLRAGAGGVLQITSQGTTWQLLIHRRDVLAITRDPWSDAETLERLLFEAGRLDESDVQAVRRVQEREGLTSEQALVKLQLVNPQVLRIVARTRLTFLLKRLGALSTGQAAIYDAPATASFETTARLSLAEHLFNHFLERYLNTELTTLKSEQAAPFSDLDLRLDPAQGLDLSFLAENEGHQRLLKALDKEPRSLADLARQCAIGEHQLLASLLALDELGCLERKKRVVRTYVQSQRIEHIDVLYAQLGRHNLFERLGLNWSAYEEEVHTAYRTMQEKLNLANLTADDASSLRDKVTELQTAADEAYRVLKSRPSRVAYRRQVADSFACENAVETFYKHLETAKFRRDIPLALEYCQRILELDPGHAAARQDFDLLRSLQTKS
jgi:hypothetical protein